MKQRVFIVGLLIFASGCSTTLPPQLAALSAPADATAGIRRTHYHAIIGDYVHRTPTDPKPWRLLNDEQAPVQGGAS